MLNLPVHLWPFRAEGGTRDRMGHKCLMRARSKRSLIISPGQFGMKWELRSLLGAAHGSPYSMSGEEPVLDRGGVSFIRASLIVEDLSCCLRTLKAQPP